MLILCQIFSQVKYALSVRETYKEFKWWSIICEYGWNKEACYLNNPPAKDVSYTPSTLYL